MKIYTNRSLFFTIFSCFAFLHLVLFPCACPAQEVLNQSDKESSHDCCDKSSKNKKKTTSDCESCESCVAIAQDCSTDLSYTSHIENIFQTPDFNSSTYLLNNIARKEANIHDSKFRSYLNPQIVFIKSSSALSMLLNRWIV